MQPLSLIDHIPLPEQHLKKLTFCSSNRVSRVADWASFLRPTQFQQTSALLYQALPEVTQLKANPQTRFDMLEVLRPFVQGTILGLTKHFLQQPIALPQEAQKSAIIAQALQKHMIDGYIIVIRDLLQSKKHKAQDDPSFAIALHRAATGIGLLFMRSYQIYTQPPRGLWLTLHALFRLADRCELLEQRITDETQANTKVTSIENAYFKTVLLASCRPHQLSQIEIRALYDAFSDWADLVKFDLDLSDDPDSFYYVNLDRDAGPLYKSRIENSESNNLLIELKLKPLVSQLAKQSKGAAEEVAASTLKVPKDVSQASLKHLLDVWGNVAQRKQERKPTQIAADFCVGLSSCHYFACNGQSFEEFLRAASSDGSIPNSASSGFTPRDTFSDDAPNNHDNHANRVEVQNVSQGGYCLLWNSETPMRVQSGDLVGIKEFGKRLWTFGVVRWIRQKKQHSQLGVQIISDKAQPYGVAQSYDMGGYSDFMRALYVPASPFSDAPATLITPSAPFQPMDRVKVLDGDHILGAKLDEQLFSTSSIQQFEFRVTETGEKKSRQSTNSGW